MKAKQFAATGLVLLSLWVVARANSPRGILDNKFDRADVNHDNLLSMQEFLSTQSGSTRYTDARFSFQLADENHDDRLSLIEFLESRGGKDGGKPDRRQTFDLADLDDDGALDPDEFALTEPNGRSWSKVWKKFGRLDKNDDAVISRDEWQKGDWPTPL